MHLPRPTLISFGTMEILLKGVCMQYSHSVSVDFLLVELEQWFDLEPLSGVIHEHRVTSDSGYMTPQLL
jgi:hypothetical protein